MALSEKSYWGYPQYENWSLGLSLVRNYTMKTHSMKLSLAPRGPVRGIMLEKHPNKTTVAHAERVN